MAAVRKPCLNYIGSLVTGILQLSRVEYRCIAGLNPDALNLSAAYIFRGQDPQSDLTNMEKEARMLVHIVVFLRDDGNLEGEKADLQERIEAEIYADVTLGGTCTQATVRNCDPSSAALYPLGFGGPVLPPLGAFRMDVEVTLRYTP